LKRASLTPDTGTTGETSSHYNAIKSFKMDGVGVGGKTVQKGTD